jgi:hypothetical protein
MGIGGGGIGGIGLDVKDYRMFSAYCLDRRSLKIFSNTPPCMMKCNFDRSAGFLLDFGGKFWFDSN